MSSYNPRSLIESNSLGNVYELIDDSLDWLLNESKKQGFDAQITATYANDSIARFGVSQIIQNHDLQKIKFELTLAKGKKTAISSTSGTNSHALKLLFDQTARSCIKSPDIPFFQGFPKPRKSTNVNLSGKEWSIEDRVDAIKTSIDASEKIDIDVRTAGTAQEWKQYSKTISSEGVDVEDSFQINYFKINSISGEPDNRGYGEEEVFWRFNEPDFEKFGEQATKVAVETIKLIDLPAPKDYEVLLTPRALSDLIDFLQFSLDANDFHESTSFATDKIGDQIFDSKINFHNQPRNPNESTIVANFDADGLPTVDKPVIEKGVLKFVPYSSFAASKHLEDKNLATGLNLKPFDFFDDFFSSIPLSGVMEKGNKSFEEQLSEVEDGLLVKSLWYTRFTLKREGGLTGLTRNGLYHIKNGEIQGAVRNLRYTDSFVKVLSEGNVISLSKERRQHAFSNLPNIHLKKFHFSSVAHSYD